VREGRREKGESTFDEGDVRTEVLKEGEGFFSFGEVVAVEALVQR
jgi:hypothetical protein